jgi:hypothetical protein
MSMSVVWEEPKMKFGKLCFGVTINGQTFWSEQKQDLEKTIQQLGKGK